MHMQGTPATMQADPRYDDVVAEVAPTSSSAARALEAAGVARDRIAIDPGFGFGKNFAHNAALLARVAARSRRLGYPVVAGLVAQAHDRGDHRPPRGASASPAALPRRCLRFRMARRSCACTT